MPQLLLLRLKELLSSTIRSKPTMSKSWYDTLANSYLHLEIISHITRINQVKSGSFWSCQGQHNRGQGFHIFLSSFVEIDPSFSLLVESIQQLHNDLSYFVGFFLSLLLLLIQLTYPFQMFLIAQVLLTQTQQLRMLQLFALNLEEIAF